MKSEFRWYRNKKKLIHKRAESWFDSDEKEKVKSTNPSEDKIKTAASDKGQSSNKEKETKKK